MEMLRMSFSKLVLLFSLLSFATASIAQFSFDAKVDTVVKLDPELQDLLEDLPNEMKDKFNEAAEKFLKNFDQSVISAFGQADLLVDGTFEHLDNSLERTVNHISNELQFIATRLRSEANCTARTFLEDTDDFLTGMIPLRSATGVGWWVDRCERLVEPDKSGLGYYEKYVISECRVMKTLNKIERTDIALLKISKLEQYLEIYSAC